jgi:hypothetical protein
MKSGCEHRVPLCDFGALEILDALPQEEGNHWLFIGGRAGRSLSNMPCSKRCAVWGRAI